MEQYVVASVNLDNLLNFTQKDLKVERAPRSKLQGGKAHSTQDDQANLHLRKVSYV